MCSLRKRIDAYQTPVETGQGSFLIPPKTAQNRNVETVSQSLIIYFNFMNENKKLYYMPPTDEVFNEVKNSAIEIWREYDDTYGYASEKISQIKNISNVRDNFMFMVARSDTL